MEYFFEHPVISGIVPIDNKELIDELTKTNLKEGMEINFKNAPPIYVKSIQDNMVILSKDNILVKCSNCTYLRENHPTDIEFVDSDEIYTCRAGNKEFNDYYVLDTNLGFNKGVKCNLFSRIDKYQKEV